MELPVSRVFFCTSLGFRNKQGLLMKKSHLSFKYPGKSALHLGPPKGPLRWNIPVPRAFIYLSFRVPRNGALPPGSTGTAAIQRDAPFLEPSFICLSEALIDGPHCSVEKCPSPESSFMNPSGSSVNKPLLQVPPAQLPYSETLHFQLPLSSVTKCPRSTRPHQVPRWGPYGVRSPASALSLMYSSGCPVREPSLYVTLKIAPYRETPRFILPLLLSREVPGTPISPLHSTVWALRERDTHLLALPDTFFMASSQEPSL